MSGFVFLRARGSLRMMVIFFSSTRKENEAETMWEASEGRARGRRRRGRDPRQASVSGVREEEEAGSAGDGSRASVGAAAPRRWWPSRGGAAAPTRRPLRARVRPTSQYRASSLAPPVVTRAEVGPMGGGGRAEGRDFLRSLILSLSLSLFFLSNKKSRREGGERPGCADAAVRALARAPGGGGRWAGPPTGARLCAEPGWRRSAVWSHGRDWPESRCSCYYQGHNLPFQPLQTRTHIPGRGDTEWVPTIRLRTLEILMRMNVFKTSL